MDSLKVGDVVCLKSDATKRICTMTISKIYESGNVECTWFNVGNSSFNKDDFPTDTLLKI